MVVRFVAVLVVAYSFMGGCAAHQPDDRFVTEALQEREAASIRLAQAIMRYCSVTTDTPDARLDCVRDQRLSMLPPAQRPLGGDTAAYPGSSAAR
jgi:hypothetical protein